MGSFPDTDIDKSIPEKRKCMKTNTIGTYKYTYTGQEGDQIRR